MIELFPDQQEALDRVLERYKEMPIGGRALVVAPTAWGNEDVLTVKEAAKKLHLPDYTVRKMIKRKELEATSTSITVNKQLQYRIFTKSVEKYIEAHPPKQKEILPPNKRRCIDCKEIKLVEAFFEGRRKCNECRKKGYRDKYNSNPDILKANIRKRLYGISQQEYEQMIKDQNNLCASCGNPETTIRYGKLDALAVDHCHATGAVRGLLCANCNRALGMLQEDPERVKALLKYIENYVTHKEVSTNA